MLNLCKVQRKLFQSTFYKNFHIEKQFLKEDFLSVDQFQKALFENQIDTNTLLLFAQGKCKNPQYLPKATSPKLAGRPSERFWQMNKLIPLAKENNLSIKVYNFSNFFPQFKDIDNQLKRYFHTEITSNAYYTPSNAQCFESHADPYNILIIQTSGKKHWKIWEDQDSPAEHTLHAGDMLILPKNMEHLAYTTDEHSLHITYGIKEINAKEFLINRIRYAKENTLLTPDMTLEEKQQSFEKLRSEMFELLEDFNPYANNALDQSLDINFIASPKVVLEGASQDSFNPIAIFSAISNEYDLKTKSKSLILKVQGYKFELDRVEGLEDFIKAIFLEPFKIKNKSEICNLDYEVALELVKHLWECGIIINA